jgi:hypothetical protein
MSGRLLRPRASGAAFDPRSIGSLEGWWDASDSSTITLVSNVVSQWNDKSGNGRNFTQPTGANRPSVLAAQRNGLNVLNFGGSPVAMNQAWTRQLSGGNTWIMVFSYQGVLNEALERPLLRMDANVNAIQKGASNAAATSRRNRIGSFVNNTSSALFVADQLSDATTGWHVVSSVAGATLGHYKNGATETETAFSGTLVSSSSTTLRICQDSSLVTTSLVHVAEILIYSKSLSAAERVSVERWLGGKWGITVA